MSQHSSLSLNDLALLDNQALDTLATLFGDEGPSALVALIDEYLGEMILALPRIDAAIESRNSNDLYVLAHTLKSSSANMGAMTVAEISKQIEAAARVGEWDYVIEHLAELKNEYPRVQRAMELYRAELER
jgi:HPt (histidine-containing phosphotransfer) domain-containing protein